MSRRSLSLDPLETPAPVRMEPLEMHGIDRVLLALDPVAGDLGEHDLDESVSPRERLPCRDQRHGGRAEIRPQEPGLRLHRIGRDVDAVLEARSGMRDLLEGLLDAAAALVPLPAVIVTAEAAGLDPAIREIRAAMRAVAIDQSVAAGAVPVQDEVLAEQTDRLDGMHLELELGSDRHPVPAEQLAHARARADLGQRAVLRLAQHRASRGRSRGTSRSAPATPGAPWRQSGGSAP